MKISLNPSPVKRRTPKRELIAKGRARVEERWYMEATWTNEWSHEKERRGRVATEGSTMKTHNSRGIHDS